MSANIEEKQIAKEILLKIMEKNELVFTEFEQSKSEQPVSYTDMVCKSYKQILKTIAES